MESVSCPVESPPPSLARRVEYLLFNNTISDALTILVVGAIYKSAMVLDRVLHTEYKRAFVDWVQQVSKDRLNVIRRAQIKRVFRREYGLRRIKIRLAGGSYWLSIPCIVSGRDKHRMEKRYMAKIVNDRSVIKHHLINALRNVGVRTEGANIRYGDYLDSRDMACAEHEYLKGLSDRGLRVPQVYGVYHLMADDYMVVMEFVEGRPLSDVPLDEAIVSRVFQALKAMQDQGMFHGDVKLDNFMWSKEGLVVFDSARLLGDTREIMAFDLACAICALAQRVPTHEVVMEAKRYFSREEILDAARLIDAALLKSELELPENTVMEIKEELNSLYHNNVVF